ncbi:hypothetical protein ACEQPO_04845 [Bacillus sp. SL00103]
MDKAYSMQKWLAVHIEYLPIVHAPFLLQPLMGTEYEQDFAQLLLHMLENKHPFAT